MTSLLIRDVDPALHARLKERAAEHGRSLEQEARELLRVAVAREGAENGEPLVALAARLFGSKHGIELDIPSRGNSPGKLPPDFSEHDLDR